MEKLLQTLNEKPIFLRNVFCLNLILVMPNNSKLPENQTYITETKLSSFNIEDEDICKIIKTLDINKARGHYEVSIRMLKLCDESVKPLSIILKNCKLKKIFPILWKKTNIVPIHKKGENDLIKRYRPVLLLPIFGKFFKRLISNSLLSTLKRMNCVILVSQAFVHLILL